MKNNGIPYNPNKTVISIGSNNVEFTRPELIASTILEIAILIRNKGSDVYICEQFPRENKITSTKVKILNELLEQKCQKEGFKFIHQDYFFWKKGNINYNFFLDDKIHLTSYGYERFCETIIRNIRWKKEEYVQENYQEMKKPSTQINFTSKSSYQQATQFIHHPSDFPSLPIKQQPAPLHTHKPLITIKTSKTSSNSSNSTASLASSPPSTSSSSSLS